MAENVNAPVVPQQLPPAIDGRNIYTVPTIPTTQIRDPSTGHQYLLFRTPAEVYHMTPLSANPIAGVQAARNGYQPFAVAPIWNPSLAQCPQYRAMPIKREASSPMVSPTLMPAAPQIVPVIGALLGSATASQPAKTSNAKPQPSSQHQQAHQPQANHPYTEMHTRSTAPIQPDTQTPPRTPTQSTSPAPDTQQELQIPTEDAIYPTPTASELEVLRTTVPTLKKLVPYLRRHIESEMLAYPGFKEVAYYDFENHQMVLEAFKNESHYKRGHYCFRSTLDIKTGHIAATQINLNRFKTPRSTPRRNSNSPARAETAPNATMTRERSPTPPQRTSSSPSRVDTTASLNAATEGLSFKSSFPIPADASTDEPNQVNHDDNNSTSSGPADTGDRMDVDAGHVENISHGSPDISVEEKAESVKIPERRLMFPGLTPARLRLRAGHEGSEQMDRKVKREGQSVLERTRKRVQAKNPAKQWHSPPSFRNSPIDLT